jgi:thioredoxin reductase (NADPH)
VTLEDRIYDLIIIGGGPAGLTAGLYAARGRIDCLLLEKLSPGGQVLNTDWVENWPGDKGISGFDLVDKIRDHAEHFGLTIENKEVVGLKLDGNVKEVILADGLVRCKSLIIASGANPTKLRVKGEELLAGKGVSYCGTCDGPFYRDRIVASVGGGDTAVEESIFLTKFAKKVYLIHRRDELRAAKIAQERALANEKIQCVWDSVVTSIEGQDKVEGIRIENVKTGEKSHLDVDGVFVFVGVKPNTEFVGNALEKDIAGFIKVNLEMETGVEGVFAAGDVIIKQMRQICTAAGDGATALYSAQRYLEKYE